MGVVLGRTAKRKMVLSGNEAMARGAIEAGVGVATAYPGTPSTEILETIASVADEFNIHAEWSTNEKVAFEVAAAAALCGLRAMVSMKHAGVNWIADPLMVVNLSGVRGGLVIVACDDPGCHSSANEQDSRFYALFSETMVLEPSDPQEAKDMIKMAFDISEKIELPVFLRSVTRVSHSRGDVKLDKLPQKSEREATFLKDADRFWISGARGLKRHFWLHQQQGKIKEIVENIPFNRLEKIIEQTDLCIVTSGVAYNYVKEALKLMKVEDEVNILKIGSPYPLPEALVKKTLLSHNKLLVIEEGEPFIEFNLKALSSDTKSDATILGKTSGDLRAWGELDTETVLNVLAKFLNRSLDVADTEGEKIRGATSKIIPERSLIFCAGCPHTATLYALKQVIRRAAKGKAIVVGDIGCYALSVMPPYQVGDIKYCMGASIGVASGLSHLLEDPVIAIIGDSTFFHAGIPALINSTYNDAKITVIVLDNMTTGMTGGQPHPGVGLTATGKKTRQVLIEDIAKSCGATFVEVVDSFDVKRLEKTIEKGIKHDGVAVIVSRGMCALRARRLRKIARTAVKVNEDKCTGCYVCITQFGCPAIVKSKDKVIVDEFSCDGCGACIMVCPKNAIEVVGG